MHMSATNYTIINKDGSTQAATVREYVMAAMHYDGAMRARLTDGAWFKVYLLADGFGSISFAQANEQCWDWSHVRDASDAALERMAASIALRIRLD
jgi:hypothetical protein